MAASCLRRSLSTSTGAGAITASQFTSALHQTWAESRGFRPAKVTGPGPGPVLPRKLGLAISGGADSMALAYLCRQWEVQQRDIQNDNCKQNFDDQRDHKSGVTAFVVDHKAREESTREANTVAGWLRDLGINTQILPLDWTGLSISAFETQARRLRFQALGKACRDRGIQTLLMGHHQDDNVETTVWRLSSGARGAGLAGISPVARIPECHGLYGVAGSGEGVTVRSQSTIVPGGTGEESGGWCAEVQVSTGGILISRPLLAFPKSRLVATCRDNGIPFVNDPTNFDPTLTPRNAIRSLLASGSLPKALQNESILSLIGKCQALIHDSARVLDEILQSNVRILDLCLASGSLTLEFKNDPSSTQRGIQIQGLSPHRLHELQALTLRRITELVSPFEDNHFPLSSYVDFTERVFPSHSSSPSPERKENKAFTLGGVLFTPTSPAKTKTKTTEPGNGLGDDINSTKWRLSRQPYMRRRDPVLRFDVDIPIPVPVPDLRQGTELRSKTQDQAQIPWTLWDNRFWIRASVLSPIPEQGFQIPSFILPEGKENQIHLVIRPLRQSDLTPLRRLQRDIKMKNADEVKDDNDVLAFFEKLDRDAPGQSRFTIPVIALEGNGSDAPLALPTLDLAFPELDSGSKPWKLSCDWKYKMIDLEALKIMDGVGISYSR